LTTVHRVLLVEDYEPFRRVIRELLHQRADVIIVGEAVDGLDAIRQAEALRPDVIMLDIGLPVLRRPIRQRRPRTHRACGECPAAVWDRGHVEAAIQLEHLWDELSRSRQMDILCAYPLSAREESVRLVRSLCAEHTAVEIA
jgi:CheY-like chemotaxis protein